MGMDFEEADRVRRELGLDGLTVTLPPDFDDPAFSRQLLGLDEWGCGSKTTVKLRTPCAPRIMTPSISAVADGPVISDTYRASPKSGSR